MERLGKAVILISVVVLVFGFHAFGCDKHELDALMELKSAINHPNGTALANWRKEDDTGRLLNCCHWDEVVCFYGGRGPVVTLYLFGVRQEEWYMNASLFLPFTHLEDLLLSDNSITGWTPHLGRLRSLQVLGLSDNRLQGIIDVYDLEALENLQFLDLDNNMINGFKRSRGNLSVTNKLEALSLSDANTSLYSLPLFPYAQGLSLKNNDLGSIQNYGWLCQLKNTRTLEIGGNGLQGQLPLCLRNLTSLESLDLSYNQFIGNIANFPFTKLTSLWELNLSNNKFQIPITLRPFANLSSLETLWLDAIEFMPDNETQHPFSLKFQLSSLSMSNCNIGPKLPHFMLSQFSLKYLDLSNNFIGSSLPSWLLENNKLLEYLILANNSLTGPLQFVRHPHYQLKVLDVSENQFNYLPTNLSHFIPNIFFLHLSKNSIKVITPSTFGYLKNLSVLDLSYNHVSCEIPKDCFKGCFSLEVLFMSHNNLGAIPSLSDSTALKILRLNNNKLHGTIPSDFLPSSLELLDMSNNNLEGQIPAQFCKFNFLNFLDLSNNILAGFLPPCFNGSMLAYLFLNKNKLNGSPSSVFENNTSLVMLDLGNNHLSGVVPKWIGDLRSLRSLTLRNNSFEGEIPNEVCSSENLSILDLSSNNISGQIPPCLGQLTFQPAVHRSNIEEYIGAFQNKLSNMIALMSSDGIFPFNYMDSFLTIQNELDITIKSHTYTYTGGNLDAMSAFDLSCNNLSGEIPPQFGSMFGVHGVNLSHNKLDGVIPSTLSNLSNIESLDLSYNDLNGNIPFELMRLTFLEVFNVSYNNLSGRIPENAQFGTFGESSYHGNPLLCGAPLLKDCSTHTPSIPRDQAVEDDDGSFDMYVFNICFSVSSTIFFVGILIVIYVNPHWQRVWFYFAEMWITCAYYFILDSTRNTMKTIEAVILRFINCQ